MSYPKFCTVFEQPVAPEGYPYELGIIVDKSMVGTQLYATFELLNAALVPIQMISEPMEQSSYGGMVRFPIPSLEMFPDCLFIRVYVTDEDMTEPLADFYLVDDRGEFILDDEGNLITIP